MKTRLILVGGFLGAGKTTLLLQAAKILSGQGHKIGLITNDQAPELVDTVYLANHGLSVAEVSGSCFCCNFPGFVDAVNYNQESNQSEVILAEPVGSCTDLSATIVQPIKDQYSDRLALSPLNVLADPVRLHSILSGGVAGLHPSAAYIYRKQLEEADTILITKSDLLQPEEITDLVARTQAAYPQCEIRPVSAKTGAGIAEWLASALESNNSGRTMIEVDYDTYAEGEAVLGWLNATYELKGNSIEWESWSRRLLAALKGRVETANAAIGHVKFLVEAKDGFVIGNLTGTGDTLVKAGGNLKTDEARLTVNARIEMTPAQVADLVNSALGEAAAKLKSVEAVASKCLSPGRPEPTYRYQHLVAVN